MVQRFFQLLFWTALIFALVMASLPAPPIPADLNDKVLHMLVFAVLAGLIAPAYPKAPLIVLFICLALFGALIEAVQVIPSLGRTPSFADWLADIVAAGVMLLCLGVVRELPRFSQN